MNRVDILITNSNGDFIYERSYSLETIPAVGDEILCDLDSTGWIEGMGHCEEAKCVGRYFVLNEGRASHAVCKFVAIDEKEC